ncbi:MAG: PH domain-containing protein [Haloferacaceae archaeon]
MTGNVAYVLTDRSVYEKHGVLSTNVVRVGVETVQNTELTKDVWGNLFDYGTVAVSTAGSEGSEVTFTDLNDPETFRDELRTVTSRYRSGDAGPSVAAGSLDAGTVDALLDDARAIHRTADRLATAVIDG